MYNTFCIIMGFCSVYIMCTLYRHIYNVEYMHIRVKSNKENWSLSYEDEVTSHDF